MLALSIAAVFALIALLHVFWAFGGRVGWVSVLPETDGKPLFTPSVAATLAVATFLFCCALLVAATGGLLTLPLSPRLLRGLTFGLAGVMALRAIGDFRWVGFFKRERRTRFARFDTLLYSPLCVALAVGLVLVASGEPG